MTAPNSLILWGIKFEESSYALIVEGLTGGEHTATISVDTSQTYFLSGDNSSSDLLRILKEAIDACADISCSSVALSATYHTVVTTSSGVIYWSHASTTLDPAIFGFTSSSTTGTTHTSNEQARGVWAPARPVAVDSRNRQPVFTKIEESESGYVRPGFFGLPKKKRQISWILIPQTKVLEEYSTDGDAYTFEHAWTQSVGRGYPLRLFENASNLGTTSYTQMRIRDAKDPIDRSKRYPVLWDLGLDCVVDDVDAPYINTHSLRLNQTDELVQLPASAALTAAMTQFTLIGWVRPRGTIAGSDVIFSIGHSGQARIRVKGLNFGTSIGSNTSNGWDLDSNYLSGTSTNTWTCFVIRHNYNGGSPVTSIVVDGTSPAQGNMGAGPAAITSHSGGQNQINGTGAAALGPIDVNNFMFFSRSLTDAEVALCTPSNKPASPLGIPNLIAWWPLGTGDTSPTMRDASGNGNHATGVNTDATNFITEVP